MAPFFIKYLGDIRCAQKEDGSVSDVVPPYWALYPADPAWGSAYISIAWYCYLFTGDWRVLEDHFESMKRYVNFLKSSAEDLILKTMGRYGDWCPPGSILPKTTPVELTSTWYFYHDTLLLARMAGVLGREEEVSELSALADEIKDAFNLAFLNNGRYATVKNGQLTELFLSQTSQALPLYLDMVPEEQKAKALRRLIRAVVIQGDCHVDTGIVGTRYLFDVLTENGLAEIAYRVATQRTYPGWGYMVTEGATTLWERWEKLEGEGMNSHNHIMLGTIDAWFYRTIAGLVPLEPGWKKVHIKPHILGDPTNATATLQTVRGEIYVSWEKKQDLLRLFLSIPTNVMANLFIPASGETTRIKEGGAIVWAEGKGAGQVNGVMPIKAVEDYVHMRVGSGSYEFEVYG
jgi:alpha-L-rhamnosidase